MSSCKTYTVGAYHAPESQRRISISNIHLLMCLQFGLKIGHPPGHKFLSPNRNALDVGHRYTHPEKYGLQSARQARTQLKMNKIKKRVFLLAILALGRFNTNLSSNQYRNSHYQDETVSRPSYLYDKNSLAVKKLYLYQIGQYRDFLYKDEGSWDCLIHTCRVILDISESPIESQWDSRKYITMTS